MVTFLQKKEPTWADKLGAGIERGAERGMQFSEQMSLDKAKQKSKLSSMIEAYKELKNSKNYNNSFPSNLDDVPLKEGNFQSILQQKSGPEAQQEPNDNEQEMIFDMMFPEVGKGMREREKINTKKFEADRMYHTGRSGKFLDSVEATSNGIPEREIALRAAESGVESGQMSPLGGDFWSAITGINALKSASGAQLEAAAKVNLIGSLERLGARPNQFIEKVSNSAFAQAGESQEAQKAKLLIARSVLDLDKEKIRLTDQISNEDREKYGFVKENISGRVDRALQPIAKERMNELAFSLQQNIESDIGLPNLSKNATKPVMKGTYLTPEMANILKDALISAGKSEKDLNKMAVKLGYEIPSNELLEKMGYVKQ